MNLKDLVGSSEEEFGILARLQDWSVLPYNIRLNDGTTKVMTVYNNRNHCLGDVRIKYGYIHMVTEPEWLGM